MNIDRDKVLMNLKTYKGITQKEILCLSCNYKGSMGLAYYSIRNFQSILGIICMILLGITYFYSFGTENEIGILKVILLLIGNSFLIVLGIARTNIFKCPNCNNQFKGFYYSKRNEQHVNNR